jgi:hypothetical protein
MSIEDSILEIIRKTPEYAAVTKKELDAEGIITSASETERYKKYKSPQTRLSILKAALNAAGVDVKRDGDAFDETLFMFGGCDSWGTKRPINVAAMRNDGSFVSVTLWDGDALKFPCKARVIGSYDPKYNSIYPDRDNGFSDVTEVSLESCQKLLQKVALNTHDSRNWTKIDEMERYRTYAFSGRIQWVNGTPIFNSDNQRVGDHPLICTDGRQPPKNHVAVSLSLNDNKSGYSVALQLPRQRVGKPVIAIPDFEDIVFDAFNAHKENVKDQCKAVREMIYDREIIGVGQASSIKGKADKDGNEILYVNLTCGFVMEMNADISALKTRETLVEEKKEEKQKEPEKKEDTKEYPKTEIKSSVESEEKRIIGALIQSANALGEDPANFPLDKVKSIVKPPNFISDDELEQFKKVASMKYQNAKCAESEESHTVDDDYQVSDGFDIVSLLFEHSKTLGKSISSSPAAKLRNMLNIPDSITDDEIQEAKPAAHEKYEEYVAKMKSRGDN